MADAAPSLVINGDTVPIVADPGVDIGKCMAAKVSTEQCVRACAPACPTVLARCILIRNAWLDAQMFQDWVASVDPKFLLTKITFQVSCGPSCVPVNVPDSARQVWIAAFLSVCC